MEIVQRPYKLETHNSLEKERFPSTGGNFAIRIHVGDGDHNSSQPTKTLEKQ